MQIAMRPERILAAVAAVVIAIILAHAIGIAVMRDAAGPRYMMVDELVTKRLGSELGREVRVHGYVKVGTIGHGANQSRFVLQYKGVAIRVLTHVTWPKCMRSDSEVVARGRLRVDADGWYLDVTELLTKCPSKYQGPVPDCFSRDTTYR
jgi:cytochrome c-type biogenesis protein CcmE